jgi:hypothetical protein
MVVGLMAARRPKAMRAVSRAPFVKVDDPKIDRALDGLRGAVHEIQEQRSRDVVQVDLVIGTNKVRHGLGRAAMGYSLTPTVASAAFAHAIDRTNPRPEAECWIEVIGTAQPGAVVEVW